MIQVVKMTDKEKMAMYMKCKKKELAEMLIQSNKHLETEFKTQNYIYCDLGFYPDTTTTAGNCVNCGNSEYMHKQNMPEKRFMT